MFLSLKDNKKDPTKITRILDTMAKSDLKFYLTGSRFFNYGGVSNSSDWDFFVQDSNEVRGLLYRLGFKKCKYAKYKTTVQDTIDVAYWGKSEESAEIHVQIVEDPERKQKLQTLMQKWGLLHSFCKEDQRVIWDLAFTIYNSLEGGR